MDKSIINLDHELNESTSIHVLALSSCNCEEWKGLACGRKSDFILRIIKGVATDGHAIGVGQKCNEKGIISNFARGVFWIGQGDGSTLTSSG